MTIQELAIEAKRLIEIDNKKGANVYLQEIYDSFLEKRNPDTIKPLENENEIIIAAKQKAINPFMDVEKFNIQEKEKIEFIKYLES